MSQELFNIAVGVAGALGGWWLKVMWESLKGSMTRKQDVRVYPEGYGQPGYEGDVIPPVWEDVEDLSTIERFGFTKADFEV